jgi:hypothetical protein
MNDDRKPAWEREHSEALIDEGFPLSAPVAIDFRTPRSPLRAANDDKPGSTDNGR